MFDCDRNNELLDEWSYWWARYLLQPSLWAWLRKGIAALALSWHNFTCEECGGGSHE